MPHFLGDGEGPIAMGNGTGFFSSHVMLQHEHDVFPWALGAGVTT